MDKEIRNKELETKVFYLLNKEQEELIKFSKQIEFENSVYVYRADSGC